MVGLRVRILGLLQLSVFVSPHRGWCGFVYWSRWCLGAQVVSGPDTERGPSPEFLRVKLLGEQLT